MSYTNVNQVNAAIVSINERLSDRERKATIALAESSIMLDNATNAMRALLDERLAQFNNDVKLARFTKANPKISERGLDKLNKTERAAEVERRKSEKACPFSRAVWLQLIRLHPGKGAMAERMQYASNVLTKLNKELNQSDVKQASKAKPSSSRVSVVVSGEAVSSDMFAEAINRTLANEKHAQRFAALAMFLQPALEAYSEAAKTKPKKPKSKK